MESKSLLDKSGGRKMSDAQQPPRPPHTKIRTVTLLTGVSYTVALSTLIQSVSNPTLSAYLIAILFLVLTTLGSTWLLIKYAQQFVNKLI